MNGADSTLEEIGFLTLDLLDRQWRTTLAAAGVKPHDIPDPIEFRPSRPASVAPPPAHREPPTAADITAALNAMRPTA